MKCVKLLKGYEFFRHCKYMFIIMLLLGFFLVNLAILSCSFTICQQHISFIYINFICVYIWPFSDGNGGTRAKFSFLLIFCSAKFFKSFLIATHSKVNKKRRGWPFGNLGPNHTELKWAKQLQINSTTEGRESKKKKSHFEPDVVCRASL